MSLSSALGKLSESFLAGFNQHSPPCPPVMGFCSVSPWLINSSRAVLNTAPRTEYVRVYRMNIWTRNLNPNLCWDLSPRQLLNSKLLIILLQMLPYLLSTGQMQLVSLFPPTPFTLELGFEGWIGVCHLGRLSWEKLFSVDWCEKGVVVWENVECLEEIKVQGLACKESDKMWGQREADAAHERLCVLPYWYIEGWWIRGLMWSYLCVRKITLAAWLRG